MKAKMLLVGLLSIVVSQSMHADIDIIVRNNIVGGYADIQVCAGENNCTAWVVPSFVMNNSGSIKKVGLASEGVLVINYNSTRGNETRVVKLPAFLDQYNNIVVVLTIEDDQGAVELRVNGKPYKLSASSDEV